MAARDEKIAAAIADAVRPFGVPIIGLAFTAHETVYALKGVEMIPEFYADLDYDGDGNLILSRVHDAVAPVKAMERVLRVIREHAVRTTAGRDIPVKAATVCVHSDTPAAADIAAALSRALRQQRAGVAV
jgi:5-oxoprolinase (ATP-hydrolysing) subunit A